MAIDLDWDLIHENIEEYINDENKIVTCKWLSLTLNLNINVAKRALHEFVRQQRKKNGSGSIHVTYFLAGLGTSKSGELEHKCIVLPEIEVDAVKKSLSVVTSCHVYSVQKANLKDYIPLYLTDSEIIKQNLSQCASQSSIKCGWVDQRATRQPTRVAEKQGTADKNEKNAPSTKTPSVSSNAPVEGTRTVSKKAEPKGSIASMFAAAGQKKGTPEVPSTAQARANDAKVVNGNHKTKPTEKKRGVLSFFASGDTTKKSSPVNVNSNDKKQTQEKTQEKEIVKKDVKSAVESDDEPEKKRRKRIRTDLFDSSDEDGESEDVEMEQELRYDEMAEVNNENPVPAPDCRTQTNALAISVEDDKKEAGSRQGKGSGNGEPLKEMINGGKRKRIMKTVTNHYMDEEGFMVSKKESVWESESEEEEVVVAGTEESKPEVVPVKQNNRTSANTKVEQRKKTVTKKSTTSPSKAKQTSLTSFFKK